jgi:hypothetical protein
MKRNPFHHLLPRMQDILFLAIFLAVLVLGPRMLNTDGDLPRHLLTGRYILETKTIPTTEPFVYPYQGQPYVSHEWLADVIFYLIVNYLGLAGLIVFLATLLASTFTFLYTYISSRMDSRLPVLVLFLWGAAITSLNWVARPHIISMFMLAIWLILADKLARHEKLPLWVFFVAMILWSNLHGEFIAGMLVLLAYTVGWTMEFLFNRSGTDLQTGARLWGVFLISGVASLLNPATYHPYITILGFVNNRYLMSRMAESNPPDFSRPEFLVLLGLLAISFLLLALHSKRLTTGQAFMLTGFSIMSLMAARNIHLYGVVAPFVLAETVAGISSLKGIRSLESVLRNFKGKGNSIIWPALSIILFGAIILGTRLRNIYSFDSPFFPSEAVTWLKSNPQEGRMFNDLNWGGYIEYHLWPAQKTFADSMADVTGNMTLQYETVLTMSNGWENIFKKYQIKWVIMPPDSELVSFLENDPAWEIIHADPTAVILRQK